MNGSIIWKKRSHGEETEAVTEGMTLGDPRLSGEAGIVFSGPQSGLFLNRIGGQVGACFFDLDSDEGDAVRMTFTEW